MAKYCTVCGAKIPQDRINAMRGKPVNTCVEHSGTSRVGGVPIITGKTTYSELQIMDAEDAARLNRAMERKGQSPGAGMKYGIK